VPSFPKDYHSFINHHLGENHKHTPSPSKPKKPWGGDPECMLHLVIGCVKFLFPKLLVTIFGLSQWHWQNLAHIQGCLHLSYSPPLFITSLNPMLNAQVCVYLTIQNTKLQLQTTFPKRLCILHFACIHGDPGCWKSWCLHCLWPVR
jgi:hypothetical protein